MKRNGRLDRIDRVQRHRDGTLVAARQMLAGAA